MPFQRYTRTVTVYFNTPTGEPDEYVCGYVSPYTYTLDVGNPSGSQALLTQIERADPFGPANTNISPPHVEVADDTHIKLSCLAGNDVMQERRKYKITTIVGT